tara:strand:+ start:1066 stop:1437 length:372 start_codon:yes stop_codon:yes gene_type:complete
MFKEEITKTEKGFEIKVSTQEIRKYSFEEKKVYRRNVEELIPEEYKGKVSLVSQPQSRVSNYSGPRLTSEATWVYEMTSHKDDSATANKDTSEKVTPKVQVPKKTTTRNRRASRTSNPTKKTK